MDSDEVVKRNALPKAIPLMGGDPTPRIGVVSPMLRFGSARTEGGASRRGVFFYFVPLDPAYPALAGRGTFRSRVRRGDHPDPTAPETEGLLSRAVSIDFSKG
jgi:hypothetical protein